MKALIAKRDTLLKTHPLDSRLADLPEDFRSVPILSGQKVVYSQIEKRGKHSMIRFAPSVEGRTDWCIFTDHFDSSVVP